MRLAAAFVAVSLLGSIAVAAFWIGRMTASAPRFEASAVATDGDALDAAWADFERAQRETLALLRDHDFYGDDLERAEAYRDVLYALVGAIQTGALMDPDHPRFLRTADWTSKSGLDNPDNAYFIALLRDDADYRVTGARGTSATLSFQLLAGQPGVGNAGTSDHVAVLDDRALATHVDGSFEIFVSRRDPGPERNWLRMEDGATTLLVRYSHADWGAERTGALSIERVGAEGVHAPPLSSEEMAARLRAVARILFDRESTWLDYAQRAWTFMPRNGVSDVRPSTGGLVGQHSAFGTFALDESDALVLTTHESDAPYQGIQLGNLWFVSLDSASHTSSLTTEQAYRSADGLYHFVVSLRDPGVQNWLDPEGHRRGLLMLRWQGLSKPLPENEQPRAVLVDFEKLREVLPATTPDFGPERRADQIRRRRTQLQRRDRG
jgi:hypothetical protein